MTTTVLLVTERPLSAADVGELTRLGGRSADQLDFRVAVPRRATARSTQSVVDSLEIGVAAARGEEAIHLGEEAPDPAADATDDAEAVLDAVVGALTAAGSAATGEVTPHHPLDAVGDMVAAFDVQEVVVMVEHRTLGSLLHSDLAGRIERHFDVPAVRVQTHAD